LISVDTLRADHLELYGYERRTMPELTAWAKREAVVFERAVAQAPWTLPSHVSMLTGLDALAHGVNYHRPAPEGLLLLPEILYARGYRTLAVTGGAYLDPQFGLAQGFERYHYFRGEEYQDELDQGLAVALAWLREAAAEPFFFFFHTYDVHEPYYAREPFYAWFAGGAEPYPAVVTRELPVRRELAFQARREMAFQRGEGDGAPPEPHRVRAMYDSGIAHTDRGVRRLLSTLEELGVADRTVVVFTSDHGEALGEHGLAGHGDLHDHTVLVPLIVKLPGREAAGSRIAEQVRSMDIVPTLLDLLRLPAPSPPSGLSLLPVVRHARRLAGGDAMTYEAIGNRGISIRDREGYKYVLVDAAWKPTAAPTEQLFDLRTDPAELRASTDESPIMRRLRRQAQRRLNHSATGLHVQIWNSGTDPLCGVLRSDILRHNSVKVPAERSFAEWLGYDRARLRLPAGEQTSLIVLDVASAEVSLSFETSGCGAGYPLGDRRLMFEPLVVESRLAALARPRRQRLEAGRWQSAPAGAVAGADAVMSVAWLGPLFAGEEGNGAIPSGGELGGRLRALGYL
jgi:arylsulfatase A-like enzyme